MQAIHRPDDWEKIETIIQKLSYRHENNIMDNIPDNKSKYAGSLELLDLGMVEDKIVNPIREEFNSITERLGITEYLSDSAEQDTWIWWDIGKQLYYNKHPEESQGYILGDPIYDKIVQDDIISRMLGFEIARIITSDECDLSFSQSTHDLLLQLRLINKDDKPGKQDGHISSQTFTQLGKYIRNGGDEIINTSGGIKNSINSNL